MKTTHWTIPAIGAGLLLSSCGGDDGGSLTKEEFIAQADAMCASTQEEGSLIWEAAWADIEAADPEGDGGEALVFVRIDQAVDELMPLYLQQLEDMRDLEPPEADAQLVAELLDDFEVALTEFAGLVDAAAGGDESAMAELDGDDPTSDVNRRAREYGLTVCGDDG